MRHRKKQVKLGRETGPRTALLRNLATSLVLYEKIRTTKAKARAVRPIVERLVTIAKNDSPVVRRRLAITLMDKNAVRKAVEVLGKRYKERPGGYTRTTNIGPRRGDAAAMVVIEFV